MITKRQINEACEELDIFGPILRRFANGLHVQFTNGDGEEVALILEHDTTLDAAKQAIASLWKVKAENQPSEYAIEKMGDYEGPNVEVPYPWKDKEVHVTVTKDAENQE